MEGKVLLAIGGCVVVAAVTYILQGGKKTGHKKKKQLGVPGLVNNGNTCYLNSVLQALASVSTFLSWIEIISEEHENQNKLGKLTSEMLTFMHILNQSCFEQKVYDASVIFQTLSSHGWVISREQQDAHEIFQVLISTLADEQQHASQMTWNSVLSSQDMLAIHDESIVLRSGVRASKVQRKSLSPFSGLFGNQMWCKTCSYKYPVKFDSFDTVSLSLSSSFQFCSITLEALIRDFMCSEVLESFQCSGCGEVNGEKTSLLKKLSIGKLPQCLCFHINRTYWQNGSAYKNNTFVTFSECLDIKPYCYNSSKINDEILRVSSLCSSKSTDEKCKTSQSRWMVNTSYTLVAVIIHLGVVEKGHYLTFRKVNDTWYFISDNNTRVAPLSHVLHSNPYILFYERTMLADNEE